MAPAAGAMGAALLLLAAPAARADTPPPSGSADSYWYLRAGYGGVDARRVTTGPAGGIGWRYVPGHVGFDLSAFNFVVTTRDRGFDNVTGSFLKAAVLYDVWPRRRGSPYLAVGLGWGTAGATVDGTTYRGSGLDAGISAGYAHWLSSAVRVLVQLDATLPSYTSEGSVLVNDGAVATIRRETLYAPCLALSVGIGFGTRALAP